MAEHLTPPVRCAKRAVRCGARTTHAIELPNVKKIYMGGGDGGKHWIDSNWEINTLFTHFYPLNTTSTRYVPKCAYLPPGEKKRNVSNKLRSFLSLFIYFF